MAVTTFTLFGLGFQESPHCSRRGVRSVTGGRTNALGRSRRRILDSRSRPTLCRQLEAVGDKLFLCLLGGLLESVFHPALHGCRGLAGVGAFYCPSR